MEVKPIKWGYTLISCKVSHLDIDVAVVCEVCFCIEGRLREEGTGHTHH